VRRPEPEPLRRSVPRSPAARQPPQLESPFLHAPARAKCSRPAGPTRMRCSHDAAAAVWNARPASTRLAVRTAPHCDARAACATEHVLRLAATRLAKSPGRAAPHPLRARPARRTGFDCGTDGLRGLRLRNSVRSGRRPVPVRSGRRPVPVRFDCAPRAPPALRGQPARASAIPHVTYRARVRSLTRSPLVRAGRHCAACSAPAWFVPPSPAPPATLTSSQEFYL
jgi:hypothetical protein